jgi:chemotaxis protein CheD
MPDELIPEVHLQPGECRLVTKPTVLCTVLGSCVRIAFHVPRLGIGALCHPLLPRFPAHRAAAMSAAVGCRYVDFAVRKVARHLDSLGAARAETQVKLFGGADVLSVADEASRPTVGRLNCEAARRVLEEEGFTVSACSLGGNTGVHIQFHTATGEVLLRRLDSTTAPKRTRSPNPSHRAGICR